MSDEVCYSKSSFCPVKVVLYDFDKRIIQIISGIGECTLMEFSDFEKVAKSFYAAYKKYKYVFEKGGK